LTGLRQGEREEEESTKKKLAGKNRERVAKRFKCNRGGGGGLIVGELEQELLFPLTPAYLFASI